MSVVPRPAHDNYSEREGITPAHSIGWARSTDRGAFRPDRPATATRHTTGRIRAGPRMRKDRSLAGRPTSAITFSLLNLSIATSTSTSTASTTTGGVLLRRSTFSIRFAKSGVDYVHPTS